MTCPSIRPSRLPLSAVRASGSSCRRSRPRRAARGPGPGGEVSLPPFEDEVERWKREADEQEARFAAERAEQQRQEAHAARANWSAWNEYVDGRIAAALAERQHEIVELAR